jgi:hypothetical protein
MAADEATPDDVHGYVEPEPGTDSPAESEIPVGVDALTDEQIAKAEEAGPADGGGDDGDALDVSALMEEGGADDAGDADADADAGDDADAGEATADDDTAGPDAAEEEA